MAGYSHYYVNDTAQDNGDHEVHTGDCYWLGLAKSKAYLGYFDNCRDAVSKAKKDHFSKSNGCKHCSLACHTT